MCYWPKSKSNLVENAHYCGVITISTFQFWIFYKVENSMLKPNKFKYFKRFFIF